jgi:hypothetical protein
VIGKAAAYQEVLLTLCFQITTSEKTIFEYDYVYDVYVFLGGIYILPVRHTSKLNCRMIVDTVQCDSVRIYSLPLRVSVN